MAVAGGSDSEDDCSAPAVESPLAEDQPQACGAAAATTCGPAIAAAPGTVSQRRGGPDPWLAGLFTVSLFEHHGCRCHPGTVRNGAMKRNENNQYCLHCTHAHGTGMCKLCMPAHSTACGGRVFQIRKYM